MRLNSILIRHDILPVMCFALRNSIIANGHAANRLSYINNPCSEKLSSVHSFRYAAGAPYQQSRCRSRGGCSRRLISAARIGDVERVGCRVPKNCFKPHGFALRGAFATHGWFSELPQHIFRCALLSTADLLSESGICRSRAFFLRVWPADPQDAKSGAPQRKMRGVAGQG